MEKYFNIYKENDDKFNINYYITNNNTIHFNIVNNIHLHIPTQDEIKKQPKMKLKKIKMKQKRNCKICNCYVYDYKKHTQSKKHQRNIIPNV